MTVFEGIFKGLEEALGEMGKRNEKLNELLAAQDEYKKLLKDEIEYMDAHTMRLKRGKYLQDKIAELETSIAKETANDMRKWRENSP